MSAIEEELVKLNTLTLAEDEKESWDSNQCLF